MRLVAGQFFLALGLLMPIHESHAMLEEIDSRVLFEKQILITGKENNGLLQTKKNRDAVELTRLRPRRFRFSPRRFNNNKLRTKIRNRRAKLIRRTHHIKRNQRKLSIKLRRKIRKRKQVFRASNKRQKIFNRRTKTAAFKAKGIQRSLARRLRERNKLFRDHRPLNKIKRKISANLRNRF